MVSQTTGGQQTGLTDMTKLFNNTYILLSWTCTDVLEDAPISLTFGDLRSHLPPNGLNDFVATLNNLSDKKK